MRDVALKQLGAPLPLLELLVLLLQPIDLAEGAGIGAGALQGVAPHNDGGRCGFKQRCAQVDEAVARVGDHAVADAAQDEEQGAEEEECKIEKLA